MKMTSLAAMVSSLALAAGLAAAARRAPEPAPNGIKLPAGFEDWRLISVSLRSDNDTIRAILGNKVAVEAARAGRVNPWPDGAVLAKLVWKKKAHEAWPSAAVPGDFVHAEFMLKDPGKYAATRGWGYARWLGKELKPYGKDAGFVQECLGCHIPLKDSDYVFTRPAGLPDLK